LDADCGALYSAGRLQLKTLEPTPVTATPEEGPAGPPLFEDVTAASGLSFTYR